MDVAANSPPSKEGAKEGDGVSPVHSNHHNDVLYGSSIPSNSSAYSSIYRHPFSSFKFDSCPSSPPKDPCAEAHADHLIADAPLSARLNALSLSPKHPMHAWMHSGASSPATMPPSPSTTYAESQHSMEEYEPDSPSSLSSWNSFMSGHRGDIADVEDLELGEPELETVSELDEDPNGAVASFTVGGSGDRLSMDHSHEVEENVHSSGSRFRRPVSFVHSVSLDHPKAADTLHRRRTVTQQHYVHAQGHHHSPAFSHFSPCMGGHGLSHHSRWTSRTPSSLAARRHKGRIAELAEEVTSELHGDINTTNLSAAMATNDRGGANGNGEAKLASSHLGSGATHSHTFSSRCESIYHGTPTNTQWSDFACLPPLPPQCRPVSPSETVPAVPSPLCECISAESHNATTAAEAEQGGPTETEDVEYVTSPTSGFSGAAAGVEAARPLHTPMLLQGFFEANNTEELITRPGSTSPSVPSTSPSEMAPVNSSSPSSNDVGFIKSDAMLTRSSSPDAPSPSFLIQLTSKSLSRKNSGSQLRGLSPPQPHRHKVPLRPCFSRRISSQNPSSSASERGDSSPRGRYHVHFSSAPPQTIRTHSPVDYDRSSCPVSNRLSVQDVEEMQSLEMEIGLLSARCSAIAAITSCKLPANLQSPSDVESASKPAVSRATTSGVPQGNVDGRPRRDSTGALTHHLGGGWPSSNKNRLSPAEHLRKQREKERERACRMAGIGLGVGGRNLGRGTGGQTTNPLIARFDLNAPPPPLPGTTDVLTTQTQALSASPEPMVFGDAEPPARHRDRDPDRTLSPPSRRESLKVSRSSSLQRTASEDRAWRRSLVCMGSDNEDSHMPSTCDATEATDRFGRGRLTTRTSDKGVPPLVHTSLCTSSPRLASIPLSPGISDEACRSPMKTRQPISSGVSCRDFDRPALPRPAPASTYRSGGCGYDSPSSAYESGSEFDLIG